MNVTEIVRWGVRVLGLVMVVLGLVIWTGSADGLIPIHMLVGLVFVIALWTVAFRASRAGAPAGLVVVAVLLGLALPVLGVTQQGLLEGDMHWLVQLVHLALGVAAIGIGEGLGARAERNAAPAV